MNIVEIAGHLGVDPETRFTSDGLKVTNLRIATNSRRKGEDVTIWWRVTLWGDRFDKFLAHVKKGSALIVIGELQKPEIYTDKSGNSQVSLEITGELIRFSPFGKGDRTSKEPSVQTQTASIATQNQSSNPSAEMMWKDDEANTPFLKGQGSGAQDYDEEPMPF